MGHWKKTLVSPQFSYFQQIFNIIFAVSFFYRKIFFHRKWGIFDYLFSTRWSRSLVESKLSDCSSLNKNLDFSGTVLGSFITFHFASRFWRWPKSSTLSHLEKDVDFFFCILQSLLVFRFVTLTENRFWIISFPRLEMERSLLPIMMVFILITDGISLSFDLLSSNTSNLQSDTTQ